MNGKKNRLFIVLTSLIGLVALIIIIWYATTPKSQIATNPAYLTTGTDKQIRGLKDAGVLYRISPESKEAFIDVNVWTTSTYDMKRRLGQTLAFYCGRKDGSGINRVIIKDWKSGRELALYSETEGMKIH